MPTFSIDIIAKFAQFQDSLNAIQRQTQSAASTMKTAFSGVKTVLGTLGVGLSAAAFTSMIKGSLESVEALHELSLQTGITVETLSGLKGIAKQAGTDLETVAGLVNKLEKNMSEFAANGTAKSATAFKQLGLSQEQVRIGLQNMDTFLPEFAKRLVETGVGGEQAGLSMQLLAKGGATALPFLKQLAENGPIVAKVTTEQAEAVHQLEVNLVKLTASSDALKREFALGLVPTLTKVSEAMLQAKKDGESLFRVLVAGASQGIGGIFGDGLKNDINSANKQISDETDRILELQKLIEHGSTAAKGRHLGASELQELQVQVAVSMAKVKELQKQVAGAEGLLEAGKPKPKPPNEALVRVPKDDSKAIAEAKAFADAQLHLIESRSKTIVDVEKGAAQDRLEILDRLHSDGLVGEKAFFEQRSAIQREAFDVELAAINAEVAARLKAVEQPLKGASRADKVNAERELEESVAKRDKLIADSVQREKVGLLDAARSEKAYRDEIANVAIALDEMRGKTVEAAAARLSLANSDRKTKLTANGDEAGLRQLENLEELTISQEKFNKSRKDSDDVLARLAIDEERIQNSRRTGAISEFESLKRLDEKRKAAVATLRAQAEVQLEIAKSSDDPGLQLRAEQAIVALESLAASADLVGDKVRGIFEDTLSTGLEKLISGTSSVKDAFIDMANSIAREITKLAAQDLASAVFGKKGGGGGASGVGAVIDFVTKFFKGGGGGGGAGWVSGADLPLGSFATGTDYVPRTGLYRLHQGERVTPASANDGDININFAITGPVDTRSQTQIAAMVGDAVRRAQRNR